MEILDARKISEVYDYILICAAKAPCASNCSFCCVCVCVYDESTISRCRDRQKTQLIMPKTFICGRDKTVFFCRCVFVCLSCSVMPSE